jgi:hypothetical protein
MIQKQVMTSRTIHKVTELKPQNNNLRCLNLLREGEGARGLLFFFKFRDNNIEKIPVLWTFIRLDGSETFSRPSGKNQKSFRLRHEFYAEKLK